jgi:hypothetical protein
MVFVGVLVDGWVAAEVAAVVALAPTFDAAVVAGWIATGLGELVDVLVGALDAVAVTGADVTACVAATVAGAARVAAWVEMATGVLVTNWLGARRGVGVTGAEVAA